MSFFTTAPKLQQAIENWRKENENGCRELPYAKIVEKIFGENSVFYVGENYHNGYHDDYCTLQYYCNATGEFFEDEWTSAFVCPSYYLYKECKTYAEAQEEGLIDIKKFNENWKCDPSFILKYNEGCNGERDNWAADRFRKYNYEAVPVEVIQGRKVKKGTKGIWFSTYRRPAYLSWQGYEEFAVLLTETGEIVRINPSYLKIQESFLQNLYNYLMEGIAEEMKVEDRQREYNIGENIRKYMVDLYGELENEANKQYVNYLEEEEKKLYYPSEKLIYWVKAKFPELNEEEVIEKGICINKKNGNRNKI